MPNTEETLQARGQRYGKFEDQARVSQRLKTVIFDELARRQKTLAFDQLEALEMICHKMARIINGDADYDDSWADIAGYASLIVKRLHGEGI